MKNEVHALPPLGGLIFVMSSSFWVMNMGKPVPNQPPLDFGHLLRLTLFALPVTHFAILSLTWMMMRKKLLSVLPDAVESETRQRHTTAEWWKRCLVIVAVYQVLGLFTALFARFVVGNDQPSILSLGQFMILTLLCCFLSALTWLVWSIFCDRKLRATHSSTS